MHAETLMKPGFTLSAACVAALTLTLATGNAHAFRLIQNSSTGRTSFGASVACDAPAGFAHRSASTVSWLVNPAGQGGKPGVLAAFQNALAAWNSVGTGYALGYVGTTSAGFATDGLNTALWASGNGCTGGCLAITALVLGPGQEILEADISFNDAAAWSTTGGDVDVQAIATHELGHSMGIHHTDLTRKRNRPTMYTAYFGSDGRTLEDDDRAALSCVHTRYAPIHGTTPSVYDPQVPPPGNTPSERLISHARPGITTLRFALDDAGPVRLDVFDIAGRELATLVDDVRSAGDYEYAWDGTIAAGRASPGVYFARVITARGASHATVLLER
jgi:hypothetical protein